MMAFQQYLDLGPTSMQLHTGLHPTGGGRDPCEVVCWTCRYRELAPNWAAAIRLANQHDWEHNQQGGNR